MPVAPVLAICPWIRVGPVLGAGVGGEPVGHPAAAAFRARHTVEDAEDLEHLPGIVVLAEHVAQAELVGLVLVVAAELHEQQAQGLLGQPAELLKLGLHGHAHDEAAHGELLLAHLARRVAAGHVADLVPEDCHQLGLGAQVRHDAASDVDVPAGQGEGVDGGIVDDLEAPGQVGPLGPGGEALAEPLDVGLDLRVRVEAVRGVASWSAALPIAISWASLTSISCFLPVAGLVAHATTAATAAAAVSLERCMGRRVARAFAPGAVSRPR